MSLETPNRQGRSKLSPEGQDLVLRYLPLARSLARPLKAHWPHVRDDLDGAACLALVEAAESFDVSRNIKFATFARYRIVGALRDLQRSLIDRKGRRRDAAHPGVSFCDVRSAPADRGRGRVIGMESPPPVGAQVDRIDILERCLSKLPKKHAQAARLLFLGGKTQVEAARLLGFSQSRLSSLRREALSLLREVSRSDVESAA